MWSLYQSTLKHDANHARRIQAKYGFSEDAVKEHVSNAHDSAIADGRFGLALGLRQHYGSIISNKELPTDDLRTLNAIQNFFHGR